MRCQQASTAAGEPLAGSAPRADAWVVVEHAPGWGQAPLARSGHGVRVLMARPRRSDAPPEGARAWVAHCGGLPVLRQGWVADPAEVAGWDLAALAAGSHRDWGRPDPEPLLLVCANGRRDPCCGHLGGRLAARLWTGASGARVLTCTHLGGHRFAPTALLLPWGVLHGRLAPPAAAALLRAAAAGAGTPTESLRGFSALEEPAQVADVAARRRTGHQGLSPLPMRLELDDDEGVAVVEVPGHGQVVVRLQRREREVVASCGRTAETLLRWQERADVER